MKYNYVYFDDGAVENGHPDKNNYYYICTKDLRGVDGINVVSYPLDRKNRLLHLLYVLHNYPKLNSIVNIPFKRIWYPFFFEYEFNDINKPICFVSSNYYITPGYIQYLKRKYKNSKFVLIHRDLVSLYHKRIPCFSRELVKKLYDLELSFDFGDCEKYGLIHFDEFESKLYDLNDNKEYQYDVFFAGAAKNRLSLLVNIYDYLVSHDIRVIYYITGASREERINRDNIIYADKNMNYRQMLKCTLASKCILEVQQVGAVGYTSRYLEAVMYNRKLITNNNTIVNSNFYNKNGINIFDTVDEISIDFIKSSIYDFKYNGEFSPVHLIEKIDSLL